MSALSPLPPPPKAPSGDNDSNTHTLLVGGMTCAACSSRVERTLRKLPGVTSANVNLATEEAHVVLSPGAGDAAMIVAAIERAGYAARPLVRGEDQRAAEDAQHATEQATLRRDVWLAAAMTLPIFVTAMLPMLIPGGHEAMMDWVGHRTLLALWTVCATVVQWGPPGMRFHIAGLKALQAGAPDMNALVLLGTTAAWTWSMLAVLVPHWLPDGSDHVWFEASAMVITLLLLGRLLEARARGAASQTISGLLDLAPDRATVLRPNADGVLTEVEIDTERLWVGERVLVRPGERIPIDGRILEGVCEVDERWLTGEPLPVVRGPGQPVNAGTIVVGVDQAPALVMEATAVGQQTTLQRIVQTVRDAQGSRPAIQRMADRVVAVFVPIVLVITAITAIAHLVVGDGALAAVTHAVAVLIIACPCAMGLAVPVSILVGTGRAAQLGVLFRQGEAVEALARAHTVAFDKTGTLTLGEPALVELAAAEGVDADEVLALAAAIEATAEHPLGRAIAKAARERGLPIRPASDIETRIGRGVQGQVGAQTIRVGALRWLHEEAVELGVLVPDPTILQSGATVLGVAQDNRLVALLYLRDALRPGSQPALQRLHGLGIRTALITGDGPDAAAWVAGRLGIGAVFSQVLPDQKADHVRTLQAERPPGVAHGGVVFVGDGINDAPALATADVGVAIGTGTDIAIEAGGVVLVDPDPQQLVRAMRIARAILQNIRWNLVWAFGYNILLIPVAAGAFVWLDPRITLSPVAAGLAMSLSSVLVVTNALRLRRFVP